MSPNPFDQACRYLAKLEPSTFIAWLLNIPTKNFVFRRWLDTRLLRFPGEPDRVCDTVAFLEDLLRGHVPWAVVIEFQIDPDSLILGRFLGYFSPLWLEMKPNDDRGDRFHLGAVLVNLTGRGSASRIMDWPEAGLQTGLRIAEINLSERHAGEVLTAIATGAAPAVVLPFIPLMQGGGESGTIAKWKEVAGAELDARRRGDYGGLALVFAEAAGYWEIWKDALKEWNMIQSKQVNEWQEQGRQLGAVEFAVELLLRVLSTKFGQIPEELVKSIQSIDDPKQMSTLLLLASQCASLDEWRKGSPQFANGAAHG